MHTLRRLMIISFLCLLPNAFGQRADALTFVYGGNREAKLISNDNSTTIQSWSAVAGSYSAHISDSGSVWYTSGGGFFGGFPGSGGGDCSVFGAGYENILEVDWNGNTIRTITKEQLGGGNPHHAITLTENGTILAVVAERYNNACGERLVEYDPKQNKVIWAWHTNDHEGTNNPRKLKRGSDSNDPYHINNIDLNVHTNQITFTSHNVFEVFVIDRSIDSTTAKGTAGDLLWRMGNPGNYGVSGKQHINGAAHSARWVKKGVPGEGNIIFLANQSPVNSNYATGYEVIPKYSLGSNGEWEYEIVFSGTNNNSQFMNSGGIDKVYNGNYVITYPNENYTAYEYDYTKGATQDKSMTVATWSSVGQNGAHRYPVCGGRLLAGVKANDPEAIALNNQACANYNYSSSSSVVELSSSSTIEWPSSSSTFMSISATINQSNILVLVNKNHITLNNLTSNARINVMDLHGVVKYSGVIQNNQLEINASSWKSGTYFIHIEKSNQIIYRQVIRVYN